MLRDMDALEIVCVLKAPAELFVNGAKAADLGAGLSSTCLPMAPGPVHVQAKRGGVCAVDFTPPEWISAKPYRTDRLVYAYSSKCAETGREIFGDAPQPVSDEYAEGPDGRPNWQLRLPAGSRPAENK
jgi:hypothetical protein